jgi:hypothetical protein
MSDKSSNSKLIWMKMYDDYKKIVLEMFEYDWNDISKAKDYC